MIWTKRAVRPLNRCFNTLGAFVADELGNLLRLILGNTFLNGALNAGLLTRSIRLAIVQRLERDAALDELRLEDI